MRASLFHVAILAAAVSIVGVGCKSANHEDHDDSTEIEITAKDVPSAVQRSFEKAYPKAVVKKIERETYKDGTIHYEYEFVDAAGKKQEAEFDDSGELLPEH